MRTLHASLKLMMTNTFCLTFAFILSKIFLFPFETIAQPAWNQKTDFTACSYDGVAFAVNGNIYYGLGIQCLGSETHNFYKYDPSANAWSPVAAFPGATRRKASAFAINGKGYVCLGYSNGVDQNDLWEYDPVANTWTAKAAFPGVGRGAAIADVINGKAYVGTGFSPMMGYPMDIWEYNPVTNAWLVKATLPGIALYSSQSFAIGDTMYVVGGIGGNLVLPHNEVWAYSATANTWTAKPNFPGGTPRDYATTFSLNGKGYCGYGMVGINYLSDFYSYNPLTGSWTSVVSNGAGGMLFNGGGGGVATSTAGYCIAGVVANNTTPPTTDLWEFVPEITAITESLQEEKGVYIYPNPAKDVIHIKAVVEGSYTLVNSKGQIINSFHLNKGQDYHQSAAGLAAGLYMVKSSDQRFINRFIVVQ
jgi:N-acetylneuraminic acid mutarotase